MATPIEPELLTQLFEHLSINDHSTSLTTVEKLLQSHPDPDFIETKAVLLIHLERYEHALQVIEKNLSLSQHMHFLKSYCLYRLNRFDEAYHLVNNLDSEPKILHLKAQLAYRIGRFQSSLEIYSKLINSLAPTHPSYIDHLINLEASKAALAFSNPKPVPRKLTNQHQNHYELMFNLACQSIFSKEFDRAENLIQKAKEAFLSQSSEDSGQPSDDHEGLIFELQLAYLNQLFIKSVFSEKPSTINPQKIEDPHDKIIFINNFVIPKIDNPFLRDQKLGDLIQNSQTQSGLLPFQINSMKFNSILAMIDISQSKAIESEIQSLIHSSRNEFFHLIHPHISYKKRLYHNMIDDFVKLCSQFPQSVLFHLALIQEYLLLDKFQKGLGILQQFISKNPRYQFVEGIYELHLWLLKRLNYNEEIVQLKQSYFEFLSQQANLQDPRKLKRLSHLQLKKNPTQAVQHFTKLIQEDPTDLKSMTGLILALLRTDPGSAHQYAQDLPTLQADFDKDQLIQLENSLGFDKKPSLDRSVKRVIVLPTHQSGRKKKSKKSPNPSDPSLDPERWVPMKQRTYFKPASKKRTPGRTAASQGVSEGTALMATDPKNRTEGMQIDSESHHQQKPAISQAKVKFQSKGKKKKKGIKW